MRQLAGQNRHFGNRYAAEIIDHHRQTTGFRQGGAELLRHQRNDFRAVLGRDDRCARFAVDPHAQLGLVRVMARGRFRILRQMTAGKGQPEAEGMSGGILRFAQHGRQIVSAFGEVACHFMHQNRPGDAARMFVVRQRNIIANDQHFNVIAHAARLLRREAEVQAIAGIVLDDQQTARVAGYRLDGGQHRIDARRGKQVAADGGGQHAFTDKARVGRLVTGTAAGDHRHVVFVEIATHHHANGGIALQPRQVIPRAGDNGSFNHVVDEVGALIKKELRHNGS